MSKQVLACLAAFSSDEFCKENFGLDQALGVIDEQRLNIYGGAVPVNPRAIDNAPTVQADAIGSGSALFVASNADYINVGNSSSNI